MAYASKQQFVTSVSLAASYTSDSIPLDVYTLYYIHAVVTGGSSPTGAFKLQSSPDNTKWVDVASSSQSITDNGTVSWNASGVAYCYVRVVYTRTSGTGTLNAYYNLK